jgi:flagellar biosynthesis/type III secretory pathway ATPase
MDLSQNTRRILQSHIGLLSNIERQEDYLPIDMRRLGRQAVIRLGKNMLRNKKQHDPETLKRVMRACDYVDTAFDYEFVADSACEVAHDRHESMQVKLYQQRRDILARL